MPSKNFVILIGGPGLYKDCDPSHDKTWLSYIVLVQMAAKWKLYQQSDDEEIHWFVYEPPYHTRWGDDSTIEAGEKIEKFFKDAELHGLRKKAADTVLKKKASNYIDRIQKIAAKFSIRYHGLKTPGEFWTKLAKFPDKSISRVWYSGHASSAGLFLNVGHNNSCEVVAIDMVKTSEIAANAASIASKIDPLSTKVSEFYGCNTKDFAKAWHDTFGARTVGTDSSISFNFPANRAILSNVKGKGVWVNFPKRKAESH